MDLNALAGKAGELINQHGEQIEAAADKVGDVVKEKFGHAEQVDMAVDKIKEMIPDAPAGETPPAPAGA